MEEKLFNKNYLCLCAANFLFFFSFYLLLPVLPFFIKEQFQSGNAVVGTVISCYTLATLVVRPFSGYMMDTFKRKPLYVLALAIFTAVFCGYPFATSITILIVIRVLHGLAFGLTSVGGNTLVIDVVPSEHRGEGIGYFGVANNIAMAVGPMTGLFVYDHFSYNAIFMGCMACSLLAVLFASQIKHRVRPPVKRPPISLDRFILLKGLLAGVSFMLLAFAYGQISNYIALYAKEMNLSISSGLFFTVYAVGLITSRLFAGKMVDRGRVTQTITLGLGIVVLAMFGLGMCQHFNKIGSEVTAVAFLIVALTCGLGFGAAFPAFNALFINLGTNAQRGTATSTYLTSWDLGLGIGIFSGGMLSEHFSFSAAYLVADVVVLLSLIFFVLVVTPHYQRNKLR
ncbi:MAG: MFS transporter [Bacteroidales bacterium]|nr:MFS transporter [Bacteroidales bacterium]